jgi:hypothetical protein
LRLQPRCLPDATQRIAQGIGMTGQRLFLSPVRVPMPSIAARTNLRRRPAQLQQDGWLSEEHLASSAQGGLLHKRQGRQRAQQQFIGHACSYSLHLQLI